MTQRPSRQPDHAHDAPDHRGPLRRSDEVDGELTDEQIDAAVRRLFEPPAVWPPLFRGDEAAVNAEEHMAATGDSKSVLNGSLGDQHTHANIKQRESTSTRDGAPSRRERSSWMRKLGIAACLSMGLFGVWLIWQHIASLPGPDSRRPPTVAVGHLHAEFRGGRLAVSQEVEQHAEGEWTIPGTPMTFRLPGAESADNDVEILGAHQRDDIIGISPLVMMRIDDAPVLLFVGSGRFTYTAADICNETLYLHGQRMGQSVVYELTPHESPTLLPHVSCDEAGYDVYHKMPLTVEPGP